MMSSPFLQQIKTERCSVKQLSLWKIVEVQLDSDKTCIEFA